MIVSEIICLIMKITRTRRLSWRTTTPRGRAAATTKRKWWRRQIPRRRKRLSNRTTRDRTKTKRHRTKTKRQKVLQSLLQRPKVSWMAEF